MKLLPLSLALVVALAACNKPADTTPATDAAPAATVAPASVSTAAEVPATDAGASMDGFELTMANVDAWMAAQPHLAAAQIADPSLDSAMNVSEEDGAQYAARLEATPALRDAIAKAGMSTHDFAMTGEALIATMMAVGALESGALETLPEGLDPQYVEFYRAHKAEIESKMQALQAQG